MVTSLSFKGESEQKDNLLLLIFYTSPDIFLDFFDRRSLLFDNTTAVGKVRKEPQI